ncbi:glycosyltransferase family 39 protein [uncultured Shewanella sp.]|uniref:ArnT family glycosyltransferase n=1 Tax=uncultured Shewanella sp. TaxID=173975 RepID=UPI0026274C81|nr:glycosyltransferase family 39 protein [uncultured Shewanella sp.]
MKKVCLWRSSGLVLLGLLIVRLVTLGLYPLMDTTESRYGEMARLMVETGNWLTPQFSYGVPFWGKPPLQTWMSAASIFVFENNEFFLRLPHFLAGVLVLYVIYHFAKRNHISAINSVILLISTVVFYISAGAVMTDMALTVGITLAMAGFYGSWQGKIVWGYLGFVGLAIGMLAKGPVTLVIFAIGVGVWLFWQYGFIKPWKLLWQRTPLISGTLLMLALCLPWYIAAEHATPGFLKYFIIGEHWDRFMDSGWKGDLYGSAHDRVRGTIWVYFIVAALPWSLYLPKALYKLYREGKSGFDALTAFLLCWMLSPLLLFTLAGNILPAYVLPGVPALALLVAKAWGDAGVPRLKIIAVSMAILLILTLIGLREGPIKEKSEKWLLAQRTQSLPTYYWGKVPFSAQYYSQGQVQVVKPKQALSILPQTPYYIVVKDRVLEDNSLFDQCQRQANTNKKVLLLCGN